MKLDLSNALILLGVSLFCGIIIVAIGFGAAFPVINEVAAPFVCSGKRLDLKTTTYSYQPGEQTTMIGWFCVDEKTGTRKDISFETVATAGLIYSGLIFAALIGRWLMANRPGSEPAESVVSIYAPPRTVASRHENDAEGAWKRLEELKRLRDSNLISAQDYENKKAEILKEM